MARLAYAGAPVSPRATHATVHVLEGDPGRVTRSAAIERPGACHFCGRTKASDAPLIVSTHGGVICAPCLRRFAKLIAPPEDA